MNQMRGALKLFVKFVSDRIEFLPSKWYDAILSVNPSQGWRVCAAAKVL